MKKIISVSLAALLSISLFACNEPTNNETDETTHTETTAEETTVEETTAEETTVEETTEEETTEADLKQNWDDDGVLKILCLGNSFSVDAMEYLYGILSDLGIKNIKLGNLHIAGCSISTHLSTIKSGAPDYIYSENTSGVWTNYASKSAPEIIAGDNWDFISFQQASHDSGVEKTYRNLDQLVAEVTKLSPNSRYAWHMTWAYQQDSTHYAFPVYNSNQITMYNRIATAVKERAATEPGIEIVIPSGTSIQNARAGWIGDTLTRDGFHLSDLGRYIAALTFAQALTGMSVENVKYAPGGFTAAEQQLAIEAASLAIAKPYEISVPTAKAPDVPSIDNLYELKLEFEHGYYFACDTNGKHFDRVQGAGLPEAFVSTQIFTRETLPEGSMIVILSDGWMFRPDGWIGDGPIPSSMRPGTSTDKTVIIDSLWWGDFTSRAFNICMTSQASIMDMTPEEMAEIFKIYVPYDPSAQ